VITLSSLSFWLNFVYFFLAIFVAFYIPGAVALRKLKITFFQKMTLGIITGMIFWGLQGFIFGFLNLRFLTYLYLIPAIIVWIKITDFKNFKPRLNLSKGNITTLLIILIGVFVQLSSVWSVGLRSQKGLFFCCGNTKDNLYHIALTNQLVKNIPPLEPGMSGVVVHNYHYLSNLIIAELIRIFHLPLMQTEYQFMTLFISLFFGLSIVVFGQIANLKKSFTAWLLFFMYFGSDLVYLVVSIMRKEINFNMGSLEDGTKFLTNPPRAFAIVAFMAGISLFILWIKNEQPKIKMNLGLIMAIVMGSLISLKVHVGFFVLAGFALLALYFLLKRDIKMVIPLITTAIISLFLYLPVNSGAGGFYYTGFQTFENFIVQPWMNLDRLELARIIYANHHNILRVIQYEIIFILLYIIAIFGTKIIGLVQSKKSLQLLPKELHIVLLGGITCSLPLGLFFQQSSGGPNSFNFLVSIFIIGSIYTALACCYWLQKTNRVLRYLLIVIIVLLTLPRIFFETSVNIQAVSQQKGFLIKSSTLDGFNYLKNNAPKNSIIAIKPVNFKFDYDEAPYISIFTNRGEFLAGIGPTKDHGIDMTKRTRDLNFIFQSKDCDKVKNTLAQNRINYIILSQVNNNLACLKTDNFLTKVYENNAVLILQFKK
jgi:hypothetical protein